MNEKIGWQKSLIYLFWEKYAHLETKISNKQNTDDVIIEILFSFWGSLLKIFYIDSILNQNKYNFQSWMWTFKMLYGKKNSIHREGTNK